MGPMSAFRTWLYGGDLEDRRMHRGGGETFGCPVRRDAGLSEVPAAWLVLGAERCHHPLLKFGVGDLGQPDTRASAPGGERALACGADVTRPVGRADGGDDVPLAIDHPRRYRRRTRLTGLASGHGDDVDRPDLDAQAG